MDTESAEQRLQELSDKIALLDDDAKAELKISGTTPEELQNTIDQLGVEIIPEIAPVSTAEYAENVEPITSEVIYEPIPPSPEECENSVPPITSEVTYEVTPPSSEEKSPSVPPLKGQVNYDASYAEMLSKPVPQRRGIVNYVGNFSGIKVPAVLKVLGSFANGTAHANGTAPHVRTAHWGTALSSGDWSLSHNETALTGELGQELVVRNGRYFTVGDTGPEMARLRRGDIVFNHRQTRDILSKGYAAGRGKAYAEGTVSRSLADGGYYSPGSLIQTVKEVKEASQDFEEVLDMIATMIERITSEISHYEKLAKSWYQSYQAQNRA